MGSNFNFESHIVVEFGDAHDREHGLVVRTVLLQVPHQLSQHLLAPRRNVDAHFVDLLPAIAAGLLERMLDVLKCLVDFVCQRLGELLGGSVQPA